MRRTALICAVAATSLGGCCIAAAPVLGSPGHGSRGHRGRELARRHKRTPACPPKRRHGHALHTRIELKNRQAVVFDNENNQTIYGCTHRYGRSYALGEVPAGGSEGQKGIKLLALNGHFAGYFKYEVYREGPYEEHIIVRDLRNGEVVHAVSALGPQELVVTRDGAVAWNSGLGFLNAVDSSGRTVLAKGDHFSGLRAKGDTVYWKQNGQAHSAVLR